MAAFTLRTLAKEEGAGEKLRRAREEKNISLEKIAKKLNIRHDYLAALENEEYNLLPSGLYGRKFLKEYCRFLRLDIKKILPLTPFAEEKSENNPFSQKILRKSKFLVFPKLIRNVGLILLFLICLLYLLLYFRRLVSPPSLTVDYPDKNLVTKELSLTIKGRSEPETEITINSASIMSDQDGNFSQEIKLRRGLNDLTISAKKKYGQESVIQRQILVENDYGQSQ